MSPPDDQWRPPEPPGRSPRPAGGAPKSPIRPRWMPWVLVALVVAVFLFWRAAPGANPSRAKLDYSEFLTLVQEDHVASIKYDASSGKITGAFAGEFKQDGHKEFTAQGPISNDGTLPASDRALLVAHKVDLNYKPHSSEWFGAFLIYFLPIILIIGFFIWMS